MISLNCLTSKKLLDREIKRVTLYYRSKWRIFLSDLVNKERDKTTSNNRFMQFIRISRDIKIVRLYLRYWINLKSVVEPIGMPDWNIRGQINFIIMICFSNVGEPCGLIVHLNEDVSLFMHLFSSLVFLIGTLIKIWFLINFIGLEVHIFIVSSITIWFEVFIFLAIVFFIRCNFSCYDATEEVKEIFLCYILMTF